MPVIERLRFYGLDIFSRHGFSFTGRHFRFHTYVHLINPALCSNAGFLNKIDLAVLPEDFQVGEFLPSGFRAF